MKIIHSALLAAVPVLALSCGTVSVSAQTAVDTVTFLALGLDVSKGNSDDGYFKSTLRSTDYTVEWQVFGPNGTSPITNLTVTEVAPCQFTITGRQFQNDIIINRDVTLDFINISPRQTAKTYRVWPNSKTDFKQETYYVVDGVKVCSKAETFDFSWENLPPAGACRNELRLKGTRLAAVQERQIDALNYLRTNFCKPRAF